MTLRWQHLPQQACCLVTPSCSLASDLAYAQRKKFCAISMKDMRWTQLRAGTGPKIQTYRTTHLAPGLSLLDTKDRTPRITPPPKDPNPEPIATSWETTDDENATQKWLVYYRPMWENPSEVNITPDQAQEFLSKHKATLDAAARTDDPSTARARRTQKGRLMQSRPKKHQPHPPPPTSWLMS